MHRKGVWYGVAAYFLWGMLPLYWKAVHAVPAVEILLHRMVWSFLFCLLLLTLRGDWRVFQILRERPRRIRLAMVSAAILSVNWLTYIWAINHNFIVEASLGYFINPLFYVFLGVLFLKESLRPGQWLAIGVAAIGVLYLTFGYGSFPWIAITLALTFGTYGLVRKTSPFESIEGLGIETGFQTLPALTMLLVWGFSGKGHFYYGGMSETILLMFSGAATALPLIFFAAAARKISLTTLGLLQYLAPTLQFLIGVLVYHEPFTTDRLVGFSFIWLALALYSLEGLASKGRLNVPKPIRKKL